MTRSALADRLVNYADAAAAFSIVNSFAFLVALTEADVRCSLVGIDWIVNSAQVVFGVVISAVVTALRRLELRLRAADAAVPPDVLRFLRAIFIVRIVIVWFAVAVTIGLSSFAFSDSSCALLPGA